MRLERLAREAKVLWSNLFRGVRTVYISFVKPRETYFAYRLTATLARHVAKGLDLSDAESKMLVKLHTQQRVGVREAAYAPIPASLNVFAKLVSRTPAYSSAFLVVRGFRKPSLVAASLTLSKERLSRLIRPSLLIIDPDAPPAAVKRGSWQVATSLWRRVEECLALCGARYVVRDAEVLPPMLVVEVLGKNAGLEEIKAVITDGSEYKEIVIPVRRPEWKLSDLPPSILDDIKVSIVNPVVKGMPFATKGALLTGPPGVGKSVMAEALADALGLSIVELRPQTYRSMWYGATERALNAIFREVVKRRKRIALIIDDAEFISSRKYTIHEAHISEISTILYHLQRPDRPFTILTANNPDLIDPAILRPGRIDVTVILGYPDKDMRRRAVIRNARRYSIRLEDKVIDKIVEVTRWFTLAEVDALLRLAAGKGEGRVGIAEVEWARKKFNVNHGERASLQEHLRWYARRTQGIVITYIPSETRI